MRTIFNLAARILHVAGPVAMEKNKEFAVLVGRAFLREVEAGNKESAIAFGRAFLLSLGMKGPDELERTPYTSGHNSEHMAAASN